jgi:transketolase
VFELAKKDPRVFFVGSDLGYGTLKKFKEEIPERFLMEGVSEANVVGLSAGLALEGKIAYVNTIATFLTRRCFEQVVLDLCLHNVNVRLIGNGGGIVYAPLGPTHLAIEDIAILRSIPNMTIIAPADANEMKRLIPKTLEHKGPIYIRLAKGGDPIVSREDIPFEIGKAMVMLEGKRVLLITTGITLGIALKAAELLRMDGIEPSILHVPTVKPLDVNKVLDYISKSEIVLTIEEHTIVGGLGSGVAEIIAEKNYNPSKKFRRIGLPDAFPHKYGSQASLMEYYQITPQRVVSVVKEFAALN